MLSTSQNRINSKILAQAFIAQCFTNKRGQDNKVDIATAMKIWSESEFSDKLQDGSTGLYLNGSAYVYELFKEWQQENSKS